MTSEVFPGAVYRVTNEPGAAFRVQSVRGDEVDCWGGRGARMQYRTFRLARFAVKPLPKSEWPTLLLPVEERPEAERARSEKRTARRVKAMA